MTNKYHVISDNILNEYTTLITHNVKSVDKYNIYNIIIHENKETEKMCALGKKIINTFQGYDVCRSTTGCWVVLLNNTIFHEMLKYAKLHDYVGVVRFMKHLPTAKSRYNKMYVTSQF